MPEKPKYFDEFENLSLDSEDELVAGEKNYIEVKSTPVQIQPDLFQQEEEKAQPLVQRTVQEEEGKAGGQAAVEEEYDEIFCRFCWDTNSVILNPLLSVCKCSGGVGYVHYECLKHWLKTKMVETRSYTSITLYWKSFGCEICHDVYPYIFKANGRKYSLVDIKIPKSADYIMLQSLKLEK